MARQPAWRSDCISRLYLNKGTELRPADDSAIGTATVLAPAQRDAVIRTRREAIVVVSGAPGTGKSHTITAMATDAIGRGESVLVAAKTDSTVDALIDLLHRVPGPTPVVFGSSARRDALAERLSAGQLQVEPDSESSRSRRDVGVPPMQPWLRFGPRSSNSCGWNPRLRVTTTTSGCEVLRPAVSTTIAISICSMISCDGRAGQ